MRKSIKIFFLTAIAALGFYTSASAEDVSGWALPEYTKAANAGVVTYNVISKNLKDSITREEFCELSVALYEKLSEDVLELTDTSPFSDSDNLAVSRAYYYGLVSGTADGKFEPDRFVTRQEMAKILENVLNSSEVEYEIHDGSAKLPLFEDSNQISEWAIPSVGVVTKYSIMSGSEGKFNPSGNATREQAILSIYRAYERFKSGEEKKYPMNCVSPSNGTVATGGEIRVNCTSIAKATKYIVLIKDSNGNLVKNLMISTPSAFKINKATLPYGENYSLTMGAVIADGSEVYSSPVSFSFMEPENEPEPEPIIIPEVTENNTSDTEQAPQKNELTDSKPADSEVKEDKTEPEQPANNFAQEDKNDIEEIKPDMTIGFEDEVMSDKAKALIEEAEKYLGIPYVYGGTTPDGFDCSGFVKYVFEKFDITLKRVSRDQYAYCGTDVERKDLQPGDLVFFGSNGVVGHVGIYTGEGQMIHSPSTGKTLCYTSIESNYYVSHYIGAKRIF